MTPELALMLRGHDLSCLVANPQENMACICGYDSAYTQVERAVDSVPALLAALKELVEWDGHGATMDHTWDTVIRQARAAIASVEEARDG